MIYIIMGFACPKPKAECPLRGRTLSQTQKDGSRSAPTHNHACNPGPTMVGPYEQGCVKYSVEVPWLTPKKNGR